MILAIDTSTDQIGIALCDAERVHGEMLWKNRRNHTVELGPAVAELTKKSGVRLDALEGVAVATGPGSFTALRVGLAFAKGLALARGIAIFGIPTLDILAAGIAPSGLPLVALLRAGRGRFAVARYVAEMKSAGDLGGWIQHGSIQVMETADLARLGESPAIVAGELGTIERQKISRKPSGAVLCAPHLCVRRPAVLGDIALKRSKAGRVDPLAALAPTYLQIPEAQAAS